MTEHKHCTTAIRTTSGAMLLATASLAQKGVMNLENFVLILSRLARECALCGHATLLIITLEMVAIADAVLMIQV